MNRQIMGFGVRDHADYDVDFSAWCDAQAALLRARAFDALDLANIVEEIESLGNEQGFQISSRLYRLLEHLLKLDASDDVEPRRKWRATVIEQRARLIDRLDANPSLRRKLPEYLDRQWPRAVAAAKAGLRADEEARVDAIARYPLEHLLDDSYFGDREAAA